MPRYKYPKLVAVAEKFAADNGLEYRVSDELPLLVDNYNLYRDVAKAPADPRAALSTGGVTL